MIPSANLRSRVLAAVSKERAPTRAALRVRNTALLDPAHPHLTGAAIGVAVGACSWVFVDLWCPVAYVPHLLVGHLLPLALTMAAGTWGGRFLAIRAPDRV